MEPRKSIAKNQFSKMYTTRRKNASYASRVASLLRAYVNQATVEKMQYLIDLIAVLTAKEMKVRYNSHYLGYLWSVLHPLALTTVYFLAFKIVMRIPTENYLLVLITALFSWQWFANSVSSSTMVFLSNAAIIKKLSFPLNALLMSSILQETLHFIFTIPVIVLFLLASHKSASTSWIIGIPVLLIIQYMMLYGLGLVLASANLFFRDLERVVTIFITLLFYSTPIVYPESLIPEPFKSTLVLVNPLAPLMISWRSLFMDGVLVPQYLITCVGYAILLFWIGHATYSRLRWKFAEVL